MPPRANPRQLDAAKSVGIWIRVSHEDQVKGESPEHHERRARMYAEVKGWEVREVYRLDAVSGKSVLPLPETQRMLRDVRTGRVSGLIFSKLARLARNTRELLELADIFREHDADLISLHESIDTTTPAGRLFYTMIAAMAQWEREEIAERVAASVPVRAKLGKQLGGQPPFGYRYENGKVVVDPKEAPVRRLMFELFLEHRRKETVARLLNEAGHRTRRGKRFASDTVDRLLSDPIAKGKRRSNYSRSGPDGTGFELKPESEWVWTEVEPIVAEELWAQCNAILEQNRKPKKRASKKPVHLFAGVAICHCGTKMYVPHNTPKYVCRACRNKIPVVDLDAVFHERLRDFFFSPAEIANYLHQADETLRQKEELLTTLEAERRRVSQEMDRIYRAYVSDEMSVEGFGRTYRPLEDRLSQLEEEIPRLQGEVDFLKIEHLSRDEIISGARDLYTRWPNLAFEEKRRIVEEVVTEIVIGQDDVTIELYYLPPSPSDVSKAQQSRTASQ